MLFNQIAGQEKIKSYLIKSINNNNISHGYIFEGPKSIGKFDLAYVFAQSILCENFKLEPCNKCNTCIKINGYNHPDLHIVDAKDESIKRETIDEIIESINKKPYESNKKVYIIKNSENMTPQAANTFLKTLEEPPGDTIIILLTLNSNLLLTTVVSRCQILKFRNINKEEIIKYLIEKYDVSNQKANIIADYSKGILNKAIRIIEEKDTIIIERNEIIEIIDKILSSNHEIIYKFEKYFEDKKGSIDSIIELIMIWMRDILLVKENLYELVINKDYIDTLERHSKNISFDVASDMIQYLQNASFDIKRHVNYKLVIDKILLRIKGGIQ